MQNPRLVAVAPIAVALLIAGCGGSSKSSSSAPPQPASTSTGAASTSSPTASGPYAPSSTGSATTAAPVALITTKRDKLGTILAYGPKKLTVYLFAADKPGKSSCTGACATVWPPVIGKPTTAGAARSVEVGTVTRPDGTHQVTYNGHPLYLYVKDKDDGDTYGQGISSFGADWYALGSSGKKIDHS